MPAELVYEIDGRRFSYALNKDEVTIGRATENDLIVEQQYISRKHAKLERDGDSWRVVDLGSMYGTRVNDQDNADKLLRDGDKIFLHKFRLTFVDPTGPGAALAEPKGEFGLDTVFHSAVDFKALASIQPDVFRLQKLLEIVTKASEVMLAGLSLEEACGAVLDLVFEHLPVQRGFIMLWDEERQDLVTKSVKQAGHAQEEGEIRFSRTIAEKVYREKVGVLTTDAQVDERFASGESVQALGIRSAMAAPLWDGDKVDGLIYVDTPLQTKAFDTFDLDLLSALGNHVAVAIEQSRLQDSIMEQKLARQRLSRYHSPAVVERITAGRADSTLMADEREVTVLFADVVEFTKRTESMEPREVAELLNHYFSEMSEAIFRHEGTLDKFIGDCLMAVFGAPLPADDHPQRAVEAALDMRETLEALNAPLVESERLRFRVGLHSGKVIAGDIGSVRRSDYTVLGSTVNLAARLESSVAQPGQIVLSDTTWEAVQDRYETRFVGEHQPKGISREVRCYELVGRKG